MSIAYLKKILPLKEDPLDEEPNESLLEDLSSHDVGLLSAKYQDFLDSIGPLKEKLEPIEQFLDYFNSEVCKLSDSLLSLQQQSAQLSSNLDLQRLLVDKLNPVILDLIIPPSVAESVINDTVDEKWVENIRFIVEKQQLIKKVEETRVDSDAELLFLAPYKDSRSFKELKKGINSLEAKSIERIRDHVIKQIRLLRGSLKSSSQVIQEGLLQMKEAFYFLRERQPQLSNQLQLAYIFTMKWYYTTRFAKYLYSLQKLKIKQIDNGYVLGANEHGESKSGLFGGILESTYSYASSQSSPTLGSGPGAGTSTQGNLRPSLNEYFLSVRQRLDILSDTDGENRRSIPSQIAETTPFAYWLEFVYNQWANALLDNVIVEYLFFIDFFHQGDEKALPVQELDPAVKMPVGPDQTWSQVVFGEAYKMGQDFVHWLLTNSQVRIGSRIASGAGTGAASASGYSYGGTGDAYAVLLIIRLVQNHQYTLHNRFHVPSMDDYHNRLLLQLWPCFTKVIDMNCDALKKNLLGSGTYSFRSAEKHQAPLNVTQQFSQFLVGLLKLAFVYDSNSEKRTFFQGEPISMSITRIRNDFEGALTKASNHMFGSGKSKATQKEIFLFNNYFLVMTILRNEFDSLDNEFIKEQTRHFEMLCEAYQQRR